ncbi:MAG: hypothetical protein B7Z45_04190 [Azorhizobium sp. 12-66-6]|nr:MAG: hypothetical protein B7Z45_04190 [Azorhizobium sp. 12-66-6]
MLLVLDEVQSGVGRTGRLFAHELSGVTPDIMAVAKGIGGGFPMGGCLATEAAAKGMTLGTHGSTYGGNPLAMAVGNAVLDLVLEESFLDHVRNMGILFKQRLAELKDTYPRVIAEVRGEGLLLGLRAQGPAAELVTALRAEGLLTPGAGDNVVRLLPPLIVTDAEISIACDKIAAACRHIEDGLNMAPVQGAAE